MHVHLIHAHPEPNSFTAAMRDVIIETLEAAGHLVTVADLYAMDFNPVLSGNDFTDRRDPDHLTYAMEQRQSWQNGTLAPDIADEIARVLDADVLAFTFPLQWFGTPAILKGWIERVFISGLFYGGKRIYGNGGLKGKRAFAAFALGGRPHMFGDGAVHGPLVDGMMKHFFQGTLGYVGLDVLAPFIAWHVPYVSDDARRQMLDDLAAYVRGLDSHPLLEMPDLRAYDETFNPL